LFDEEDYDDGARRRRDPAAAPARTSEEDPFDCSALEIPSLHGLVEREAENFVAEWRELDGRKLVVAATTTASAADDAAAAEEPPSPPNAKKKRRVKDSGLPSWYDHPNRIRLPLGFDYLCRHSTPQEAVAAAAGAAAAVGTTAAPQSATRDSEEGRAAAAPQHDDNLRVLSLADPSLTTSYHAELWALFSRIPSASELESEATGGDSSDEASPPFLPRMRRLRSSCLLDPQPRATSAKTLLAAKQDARSPLLLLERLRLSDRHEVPPFSRWEIAAGGTRDDARAAPRLESDAVATIRFECWRVASDLPPPRPSVLPQYVAAN
jgi:hypothetical protein